MSSGAGTARPSKGKARKSKRKGANANSDEKGVFRPYHSQAVPKSVDLQHQFQADRPKTTVMLRNIPNRYTQASLLQEIDDTGFKGTYDFFYLPMDTQNRTNVGYAFINFLTSEDCEKFAAYFAGHNFQDHASQKIARVSFAHIQGFIENIRHFSNRAVSQSRNNQYRPIVIHEGERMDLQEAYDLLCCVQSGDSALAPHAAQADASQAQTEFREFVRKGPLPPGLTSSCPVVQAPLLPPPSPTEPLRPSCMPPLPTALMQPQQEGLRCGEAFTEAKRGFEAAISMLLQSYPQQGPPGLVQAQTQVPVAASEPFGHGDSSDEETSTEGGCSAPGSPRLWPSKPVGSGDGADTPRTNRTLFVPGQHFSI